MKATGAAKFFVTLTACGAAATLLVGCNKPEATNAKPAPEIRGEAISAPVAQPAKEAVAVTPAAPVAPSITPVPSAPTPAPATAAVTPSPAPAVPPAAAPLAAPAPAVATAPTAATPVAVGPAPKVAAEVSAKGNEKPGEYLTVGFDKLASFNFEVPDETPAGTNKVAVPIPAVAPVPAPDQIPAAVRALDKKFVALKGFMLPLKVENGLITELLIMRDQSMCCYGAVPKINEWVSVKMTGKGVKPIMDQAVTLHGRLHVGEVRENGYLVGIYTMDGDKITGPVDL